MSTAALEPIVCEVEVSLPAEKSFRLFTTRFSAWWPAGYTFSKKHLAGMHFGQAVGDWCYERGPHGFRCDWGRILEWDPPHLLAFTWHIGPRSLLQPDPDQCTEVRGQFSDVGPNRSRVALTHEFFERHGAEGAGYRADMASKYGWPMLLEMFVAAAEP